MLELIDNFLKKLNNENDLTIKQFLIMHLSQPDLLFLRFLQKNVSKGAKILTFTWVIKKIWMESSELAWMQEVLNKKKKTL